MKSTYVSSLRISGSYMASSPPTTPPSGGRPVATNRRSPRCPCDRIKKLLRPRRGSPQLITHRETRALRCQQFVWRVLVRLSLECCAGRRERRVHHSWRSQKRSTRAVTGEMESNRLFFRQQLSPQFVIPAAYRRGSFTTANLIASFGPWGTGIMLVRGLDSSSFDSSYIRRIQRIQVITIAWMTMEAVASLFAAWRAHSPTLLAFGGDSAIKLFSAVVVLWRSRASAAPGFAGRRAARLAGALLFMLAAYVAATSFASLPSPLASNDADPFSLPPSA